VFTTEQTLWTGCRIPGGTMDNNTLLIIIVVVLLLGGGGFFFRGRR
jgi:LPXTG-motif cell wall-anchored protein